MNIATSKLVTNNATRELAVAGRLTTSWRIVRYSLGLVFAFVAQLSFAAEPINVGDFVFIKDETSEIKIENAVVATTRMVPVPVEVEKMSPDKQWVWIEFSKREEIPTSSAAADEPANPDAKAPPKKRWRLVAARGWLQASAVLKARDAIPHYTAASVKKPYTNDAVMDNDYFFCIESRAKAHALLGETDKAIADWEHLKTKCDASHLSMELGDLWAQKSGQEAALPHYTHAIEVAHDVYSARFQHRARRAKCFIDLRRFDEARKDLELALKERPDHALANLNMADLLLCEQKFAEAEPYLTKAIAAEPEWALPVCYQAEVLEHRGELDAALQMAKRGVELSGGSDIAYDILATVYTSMKNDSEALNTYNAALKKFPKFSQALAYRGALFADQGNNEAAQADFQNALSIGPTNARILRKAAYFFATTPDDKIRDGKKALTLAEKALERARGEEKSNPWFHVSLAAAQAETGDFESAVFYAKQALKSLNLSAEDSAEIERGLAMYRDQKPYRHLPNTTR